MCHLGHIYLSVELTSSYVQKKGGWQRAMLMMYSVFSFDLGWVNCSVFVSLGLLQSFVPYMCSVYADKGNNYQCHKVRNQRFWLLVYFPPFSPTMATPTAQRLLESVSLLGLFVIMKIFQKKEGIWMEWVGGGGRGCGEVTLQRLLPLKLGPHHSRLACFFVNLEE